MRLGVGHDARGLLRGVERDLVRSAPIVQLGLALLGLGHDGVDAGIVFELLEPIQIVCVDDSNEACLVDRALDILVEEVPEGGAQHGALENSVFEGHLGRALAIHDHLGTCQREQCRVNFRVSPADARPELCRKPRTRQSTRRRLSCAD